MGLVLLALRPAAGADAALHRRQVRQAARRSPQANAAALQAGYNYGDTDEMFTSQYHVKPGQAAPGHVPQHDRQPGHRPGAWSPRPSSARPSRCSTAAIRSRRPATSCTSWSGTRTSACAPSRPRTRSPPCARPSARRSAARWPSPAPAAPASRSRAEAIGLAVMTELPLVDRQRAARRAQHRLADQDRAGRPAAGHVRPQRRVPDAGDRRAARPTASTCARGLADRRAVHDAGDAAHRRLHRQRLRAVADSRRRTSCRRSRSRSAPIRPRDVPALRPRRAPRPALGTAGHAGPDAPHRRPGEAGHHRRTSTTTRRNHQHMVHLRAARSPASPDIRRSARSTAAAGELLCGGWGSTLRRDGATAEERAAGRGGLAVGHLHLRYLNPLPAGPGRRFSRVIAGCWFLRTTWGSWRCCSRARSVVDARRLEPRSTAVHSWSPRSTKAWELAR